MPKHPLFSSCLLFLAEALALSKVTSLTSASLLHCIANTHLPCRKQAWISNVFFPPASDTNATSVSTWISEHEISFQYSVYQKGVDNVRKRLHVEGTQRKFNHCLLQLCDRSHLALTLTHTPEFCWQQQLLISPSILVPLQILPRSSSYMWALAVLRVSTEGQNSLIRSCFPISFGQQWWIFQILQEILQ